MGWSAVAAVAVAVAGSVMASKAAGKPPKVATGPLDETASLGRQAKTARSALYETAGGVSGSELDPNQVQRRSTLLGN